MKLSPSPPAYLSDAMRKWWSEVVKSFVLGPHHLLLLERACRAWDRAEQAREAVQRDGVVVPGREGGLRPHPSVGTEDIQPSDGCASGRRELITLLGGAVTWPLTARAQKDYGARRIGILSVTTESDLEGQTAEPLPHDASRRY
jgi:hypothetical protein